MSALTELAMEPTEEDMPELVNSSRVRVLKSFKRDPKMSATMSSPRSLLKLVCPSSRELGHEPAKEPIEELEDERTKHPTRSSLKVPPPSPYRSSRMDTPESSSGARQGCRRARGRAHKETH